MDGKSYRALRRLSNKDDQTLAEVGDTCERVPQSSLPGLLHSKKIELIPKSEVKPVAPKKDVD